MAHEDPTASGILGFLADRLLVLRAAHSALKEFQIAHEVSELLDIAEFLAGDKVPGVYEITIPRQDTDDVPSSDSEDPEQGT